jgi:hypothetical protein
MIVPMPRIELELPDRVDRLSRDPDESFDRLAFAERLLALLRPERTTVALCEGSRIHVEAGRQWGGAPGARWAIVSVPRDASRRAIADAVLGLFVREDGRPWVLDVLLRERGS